MIRNVCLATGHQGPLIIGIGLLVISDNVLGFFYIEWVCQFAKLEFSSSSVYTRKLSFQFGKALSQELNSLLLRHHLLERLWSTFCRLQYSEMVMYIKKEESWDHWYDVINFQELKQNKLQIRNYITYMVLNISGVFFCFL